MFYAQSLCIYIGAESFEDLANNGYECYRHHSSSYVLFLDKSGCEFGKVQSESKVNIFK